MTAGENDCVDTRAEAWDKAVFEQGIRIEGGRLHEHVNQLERLLIRNPECGVYQRGGILVEISKRPTINTKHLERAEGSSVIVKVSSSRIRELGTLHGKWTRHDKRENELKTIDCPKDIATTFTERSSWELPVLSGIIGAPTITSSGRLIVTPGYDHETGLYLEFDDWPEINKNPTRDEAIAAVQDLLDIIKDFPFIDDAARATWLGALFTATIRWSLTTAPFFGFDAPVMGSGKTLLTKLIGNIVNGYSPAMMSYPRDEAELTKALFSTLIEGDPIIVIDNIETTLRSQFLCVIGTSNTFKGRILGESKSATASTAVTIMLTGNNLFVYGDLATRILISRLDPMVERPEEREGFTISDIEQYVKQERKRLLNDVLTVFKAYEVAGRPDMPMKIFGRFEEWGRMVRAPLLWVGVEDPCQTRSRVQSVDELGEQLGEFVGMWWQLYQERMVTVKDMLSDTAARDEEDNKHWKDILHGMAADGSSVSTRRLGKKIAKWEGLIRDGFRITRCEQKINNMTVWKLEQLPTSFTSSTSFTDCNAKEWQEKTTNYNNTMGNTTGTSETSNASPGRKAVAEAISTACEGLTITPEQFTAKLSPDDLADIEAARMNAEDLRGYAEHFNQELAGDED